MSLASQIQGLATRAGTEFKAIRALTGALSALNTSDKSNLVAAINEIKLATASAAGVDDATTSTSKAWSSSKTNTAIASAVSNLVASSPAALDTLAEIAAALGSDANFATTMTTALGNRLRVDGTQTLTAAQKAFGIANLGAATASDLGDPATNFVTTFEAALV